MAKAFKEDVQGYLPEYYQVLTADDQYLSVAGSLQTMKTLARNILLATIGTTVGILSLVILLFLRERRQEMGIYLSLGEKKGKITGQVVIEIFIVGLVALSLALVSGNFLGKAVSNELVKVEGQAASTSNESFVPTFIATSGISQESVSESYQVTFTSTYLRLFYLVGTGTLLLGTLIPSLYLLRLNPKKILM